MSIAIILTLLIIANICLFGWMVHGRPKFLSTLEHVVLIAIFLTGVAAGAVTIAHVWVTTLT